MNEGGYLLSFVVGTIVGIVGGIGIEHWRCERKREDISFAKAEKTVNEKATELDRKADQERKDILNDLERRIEEDRPEIHEEPDTPDIPGPGDDDEEVQIVSENDYLFRFPRMEEARLIYYKRDGILVSTTDTGEDEAILDERDDIPEQFGDAIMWELENTEEDIVYVVDPNMNMKYEIWINKIARYFNIDEDEEEDVGE